MSRPPFLKGQYIRNYTRDRIVMAKVSILAIDECNRHLWRKMRTYITTAVHAKDHDLLRRRVSRCIVCFWRRFYGCVYHAGTFLSPLLFQFHFRTIIFTHNSRPSLWLVVMSPDATICSVWQNNDGRAACFAVTPTHCLLSLLM